MNCSDCASWDKHNHYFVLYFFLTETSPHLRISEKTSQSSLKGGRLRSFNNDGNTGETRHLTATPRVCRKQPSGVTSESHPPTPYPSTQKQQHAGLKLSWDWLWITGRASCKDWQYLRNTKQHPLLKRLGAKKTTWHMRGCRRAEQRCLIETLMKQLSQTRAIHASWDAKAEISLKR